MPIIQANPAAHHQLSPFIHCQVVHIASMPRQDSEAELTFADGGAPRRSVCAQLPPERRLLLCCSAHDAPCPSAYPATLQTASREPFTCCVPALPKCLAALQCQVAVLSAYHTAGKQQLDVSLGVWLPARSCKGYISTAQPPAALQNHAGVPQRSLPALHSFSKAGLHWRLASSFTPPHLANS